MEFLENPVWEPSDEWFPSSKCLKNYRFLFIESMIFWDMVLLYCTIAMASYSILPCLPCIPQCIAKRFYSLLPGEIILCSFPCPLPPGVPFFQPLQNSPEIFWSFIDFSKSFEIRGFRDLRKFNMHPLFS